MVQEITDGNFAEFVQNNTVAMVDFWAPWCGPCRTLSERVDALAKEMEGKVAIGKLNIDQNRDVCDQYGIMSIPTLLFFKNGELMGSMSGAHQKADIQNQLNSLIG